MMKDKLRIYKLAVKYWLQGDKWNIAVEYATAIIQGFKNCRRNKHDDPYW